MSPRARRWLVGLGVLAGVQAVVVAVYLAGREQPAPVAAFASAPLTARPAPALVAARRDGSEVALAQLRGRPVLVHFWATWCAPCGRELPGLLAATAPLIADGRLALLAVAIDDDWDELARFFPAGVPATVVRPADAAVHHRFGTRTLPDSYVVDAAGQLVERFAGARDWATPAARAALARIAR